MCVRVADDNLCRRALSLERDLVGRCLEPLVEQTSLLSRQHGALLDEMSHHWDVWVAQVERAAGVAAARLRIDETEAAALGAERAELVAQIDALKQRGAEADSRLQAALAEQHVHWKVGGGSAAGGVVLLFALPVCCCSRGWCWFSFLLFLAPLCRCVVCMSTAGAGGSSLTRFF